MPDEVEYENLNTVISFDGFDYGKYYEHEQEILKPRMEEAGYSNIVFAMGEQDSFGPLTRMVQCTDADGNDRLFFYG